MTFIVEQKNKGKIYLYSVDSYWDKEAHKTKQKRTYLGPKSNDKMADLDKIASKISVKNYGNTFLLNSLAEKSGLKNLLKQII